MKTSRRRLKLRWTNRAREDLVSIGRYITQDNPGAARAWIESILVRARDAAKLPLAGRVVPERDREDVREILLRNYRIVYRVLKDEIHVLTVFEGHRLFPKGVGREKGKKK